MEKKGIIEEYYATQRECARGLNNAIESDGLRELSNGLLEISRNVERNYARRGLDEGGEEDVRREEEPQPASVEEEQGLETHRLTAEDVNCAIDNDQLDDVLRTFGLSANAFVMLIETRRADRLFHLEASPLVAGLWGRALALSTDEEVEGMIGHDDVIGAHQDGTMEEFYGSLNLRIDGLVALGDHLSVLVREHLVRTRVDEDADGEESHDSISISSEESQATSTSSHLARYVERHIVLHQLRPLISHRPSFDHYFNHKGKRRV